MPRMIAAFIGFWQGTTTPCSCKWSLNLKSQDRFSCKCSRQLHNHDTPLQIPFPYRTFSLTGSPSTMGVCSSCCGRSKDGLYEPALADSEREAVADLLQYLENRTETDFFSGEPLRALSTLVYSENVDLQRSASLTFAEITERGAFEPYGTVSMPSTNDTLRCPRG